MNPSLHITGDTAADALLSDDPLALLIGMLLDQQVPMETAFAGPAKLRDRLGRLDPAEIASYDADKMVDLFRISPSIHASTSSRIRWVATSEVCPSSSRWNWTM